MESAKYNISKSKQGQSDKSRSVALTPYSFRTCVLGLPVGRLANFEQSWTNRKAILGPTKAIILYAKQRAHALTYLRRSITLMFTELL